LLSDLFALFSRKKMHCIVEQDGGRRQSEDDSSWKWPWVVTLVVAMSGTHVFFSEQICEENQNLKTEGWSTASGMVMVAGRRHSDKDVEAV
jgi:heme/copper-type cytochrome/quinol oxidase subunit 3